jgi:acetyl-CoA carboxylase carboxyl transferase subunit beta
VELLLDPGSFREEDRGVTAIDPLSFEGRGGYRSRVINAQRRTGLTEAALTGSGSILGREVTLAVLDFAFLGGSIGVVAGERLARAFERAATRRMGVITVCSTSGTRMQEGLLALMQAPRIASAIRRHEKGGLPHISVITDPTTGSAYTGFVNLADIIIAEPNALVGYGALRVLQEAEGHSLPERAHTSESHLERGLVDAVVARPQLRDTLALLLDLLAHDEHTSIAPRQRHDRLRHTPHGAWQQVQISRHRERPTALDLARLMVSAFVEIHGDRMGGDDQAVAAGPAWLGTEPVMLIAQVRRRGTGDGRITATGFRKAQRALALAGKFGLPVITLIDTPGADTGLASEETGLGSAVARCMAAMLEAPVPTIAVITGEGSSEGAMAMAVADRVLMLDNAVYEVIRPEEAARILAREAGEVAERLQLTSHDCLKLGIADASIPEPGEGAHTNPQEAALMLRRSVLRELARLEVVRPKRRMEQRARRYREIGSTRSWVRGTIERRVAHFADRMAAFGDRVRRRSRPRRRDFDDFPEIPV